VNSRRHGWRKCAGVPVLDTWRDLLSADPRHFCPSRSGSARARAENWCSNLNGQCCDRSRVGRSTRARMGRCRRSLEAPCWRGRESSPWPARAIPFFDDRVDVRSFCGGVFKPRRGEARSAHRSLASRGSSMDFENTTQFTPSTPAPTSPATARAAHVLRLSRCDPVARQALQAVRDVRRRLYVRHLSLLSWETRGMSKTTRLCTPKLVPRVRDEHARVGPRRQPSPPRGRTSRRENVPTVPFLILNRAARPRRGATSHGRLGRQ